MSPTHPQVGLERVSGFSDRGDQIESAGQRTDLHVLADPLLIGGRGFMKCSCGMVFESFGTLGRECPIGDAEADYADAIRRARERRDVALARWREISEFEQAELHRLTGTTEAR